MARYCLDANILIQAKNGLYSFDLLPSFWSWLHSQIENGNIYAPQTVYNEWKDQKDELSDWVKNCESIGLSTEPSTQVQMVYGQIADYVHKTYKRQEYVREFLEGGDAWVIAQAKVDGSIVVTEEQLVPPNSSKIKIPNVCHHFDIPYCNTKQMVQALGFRV